MNSAAHADLWCGPGAAKISIKHFFANVTAKQEVGAGLEDTNTCSYVTANTATSSWS